MDGLLLADAATAVLVAAGASAPGPLLLLLVTVLGGIGSLLLDVLGLALACVGPGVPLRWSFRMMMKGSSGRASGASAGPSSSITDDYIFSSFI